MYWQVLCNLHRRALPRLSGLCCDIQNRGWRGAVHKFTGALSYSQGMLLGSISLRLSMPYEKDLWQWRFGEASAAEKLSDGRVPRGYCRRVNMTVRHKPCFFGGQGACRFLIGYSGAGEIFDLGDALNGEDYKDCEFSRPSAASAFHPLKRRLRSTPRRSKTAAAFSMNWLRHHKLGALWT